ncbi:IS5 family transposase [Luteimonas terrae]|uniref:IS5 family transposase n=1 Tax=Luteimonas terrae TaxID=1530191 RepID=A0ABU1Y1W4_9GAMM|nr:IS5 family transposase [Luteimonas terrae]
MRSMQLSFGDAEDLGQRKRTRREVFLAEMEQVVPWPALLALIEPHYPKMGRSGGQPYVLSTMLRIHFLQQWYALSDRRPPPPPPAIAYPAFPIGYPRFNMEDS